MNQKIPLIATSTAAILFMMAMAPAVLSAFASASDSDVSCSPVTGNPYQEKCGDTKEKLGDGKCSVRAPEDKVTHTPSVDVRMRCS
jgi:hypothetical protein